MLADRDRPADIHAETAPIDLRGEYPHHEMSLGFPDGFQPDRRISLVLPFIRPGDQLSSRTGPQNEDG